MVFCASPRLKPVGFFCLLLAVCKCAHWAPGASHQKSQVSIVIGCKGIGPTGSVVFRMSGETKRAERQLRRQARRAVKPHERKQLAAGASEEQEAVEVKHIGAGALLTKKCPGAACDAWMQKSGANGARPSGVGTVTSPRPSKCGVLWQVRAQRAAVMTRLIIPIETSNVKQPTLAPATKRVTCHTSKLDRRTTGGRAGWLLVPCYGNQRLLHHGPWLESLRQGCRRCLTAAEEHKHEQQKDGHDDGQPKKVKEVHGGGCRCPWSLCLVVWRFC